MMISIQKIYINLSDITCLQALKAKKTKILREFKIREFCLNWLHKFNALNDDIYLIT